MRKFTYFLLFLFIIVFFVLTNKVFSLDCEQISDSGQKRSCLEQKVSDLRQKASTLSSEIQIMDTQISLTTLKIQETEQKIETTTKEIDILGSRIEGLDNSLNYLSGLLLKRVAEGYKNRSVSLFNILLDSDNASDFISRIKYLKTAQDNNQKIIIQVQETKLNFEEQKKIREEKKKQLDALKIILDDQKITLNNQKAAKQKLLIDTQNDEIIYQSLLEKAKAEYAAIQGIIAGGGSETKLKDVNKREVIAHVIQGASCNSSGGHLHFIVQDNASVSNPFNYLRSVDYRNCSGSLCSSNDGDAFTPSGNWDWPVNPTIELEQGYGNTWAVKNSWVGRIYTFHNGIDINGSSDDVFAVDDGVLYKGGYSIGCTLSYVKLIHKNSNITTYYLHVYP